MSRPTVSPFAKLMYGQCRVWRETNQFGTEVRCIRLPNGQVYRATLSRLAHVAIEALADPEDCDEQLAILDRLIDEDEWAFARDALRTVGAPVHH